MLRIHGIAVGHTYVGWIRFASSRMQEWSLRWLAGLRFLGGRHWLRLKRVSTILARKEGGRKADRPVSNTGPEGKWGWGAVVVAALNVKAISGEEPEFVH